MDILAIVNADETKCAEGMGDKDAWKCVSASRSFWHLESKGQPQYDTYMIGLLLGKTCINFDEASSIFSPKDCSTMDILEMDIIRSNMMLNVLNPLEKEGHSVWSNACGWHVGLNREKIYNSDSYRAAMNGSRWTLMQAVEEFVFEGETVVEIDAYSWPYNTACAFAK